MTKQPITKHQLELCELDDPKVAGLESYSPFCLKVHRALKLARLDYRRRHATRGPAEFRRFNSTGQVPVLLIDGEPVFDSTAILARIDLLSPGALAHAEDPHTEAEIDLFEELADTSINAYLVAARWADDRNWPLVERAYFGAMPKLVRAIVVSRLRKRVIGTLIAREVWRRSPDHCWAQLLALLDRLEDRAPKEGFWLTDRVSAADLAIFAQLHSLRTPLTRWQSERVAERPALSAYLDRVGAATSGAWGMAAEARAV